MAESQSAPSPIQIALERIADGASYREAASAIGWHRSKLWRAISDAEASNPELASQYARAREWQAHADADRIGDVIDELLALARSGQVDNAVVQAYRTAADKLQWAAARKHPKVYGDRIDLTVERTTELVIVDYSKRERAIDAAITDGGGREERGAVRESKLGFSSEVLPTSSSTKPRFSSPALPTSFSSDAVIDVSASQPMRRKGRGKDKHPRKRRGIKA